MEIGRPGGASFASALRIGAPETPFVDAAPPIMERAASAEADAAPRPSPPEPRQSRLVPDPKTRDLLFQVLDPATGEVLRQLPDESILKLRAYVQQIEAARAEAAGGIARTA